MPLPRTAFFAFSIAMAACAGACSGGSGNLFNSSGSASGTGAGSTESSGTLASTGGSSGGTGGTLSGPAGSTTVASTTAASTTAASSGSTSSGSTTYPAPFPPPPQVITFGGAVLSSPKIYPVFFSNDDDTSLIASLTAFSQGIGSTPYWTAATSEYGVGPATGEPAIMLTEPAPATIDDNTIQTWLAQEFATNPAFPTPDANTLIVLYYPTGTTITLEGDTSCQTFGGYHNGATVGQQSVAYAVVPRCDTTLETATSAGSHELVEASTDPNPMNNAAYLQVDDADIYWELILGGGEVGDMCAQFQGVFTEFPPFDYTVQRIWSNKAALAGHDPCVPQPAGEVYFNAAPVMNDTTMLMGAEVRAVTIPVGQSLTIPVELFSDGPMAAWTVGAVDPAMMLGSADQLLDFTWDKTTGQNGDVLQLTIKVLQAGPGNIELFYITSQNASQLNVWFGSVGN
jgi:hypothetical protein